MMSIVYSDLLRMTTMNNFVRAVTNKLYPFMRGSSRNTAPNIATDEQQEELLIPGNFRYQEFSTEALRKCEQENEDKENIEELDYKETASGASEDDSEVDYLIGDIYDTYSFDRKTELKNSLQKNFLEGCNVSPTQRKQLLKWLLATFIGIHRFELVPDVHHLAVAILDRYVQAEKKIPSNNLKLVAISCVMIAVKMEDGLRTDITLEDCAILTSCKYSRPEIAEMEKKILFTLDFKLIIPSSYHFLARCNLISKACEMEKFLGMYILEIAFTHYNICHIYPSLQAASANFMITALVNDSSDLAGLWSPALKQHTAYNLSDLKPVVRLLADKLYKISKRAEKNCIYKKYTDEKFCQISKVVANSLPRISKLRAFE